MSTSRESNWIADKMPTTTPTRSSGRGSCSRAASTQFPSRRRLFRAGRSQETVRRLRAARATRVRSLRGGISGARRLSPRARAAVQEPRDPCVLMNPFAADASFTGPEQPEANTPYEDKVAAQVWPFLMAAINNEARPPRQFPARHRWGRNFNTTR